MRVGQKGRPCHRWWLKGERISGRQDRRFSFASLFGAARADGSAAFALVLPEVSTTAMRIFPGRFAATLAPDEHAVMLLDGAGWHGAEALLLPPNVTPVPLPPCTPQLKAMERVWLYLRRADPELAHAPRRRGHHRRLPRRLERPPRRGGPAEIALPPAVDRKDHSTRAAV